MFYKILHKAVQKQDLEDVISHISHGTDLNAKDAREKTPLYLAVDVGVAEIVELLIDAKADLNLRSNHRFTPLHRAIVKGNFEIVKLLVEAGAETHGKTELEENALSTAVYQNNVSLVKFFLSHGITDVNSLTNALNTACY